MARALWGGGVRIFKSGGIGEGVRGLRSREEGEGEELHGC